MTDGWQLTKDLQNEVLVQSSVIAEAQDRLEKAKIDTVLEEQLNETREDEAKEAIRELGEAQVSHLTRTRQRACDMGCRSRVPPPPSPSCPSVLPSRCLSPSARSPCRSWAWR